MNILDRIVATKRQEIASLHSGAARVREAAERAAAPRDFHGALAAPEAVSLIAEVKRRSPGAGEIRPGLHSADLASQYADSGASALSVLTDAQYFGGHLSDLSEARDRAAVPALRKDFTIDPLQVYEARAGGADAILLIVRILDPASLTDLQGLAWELGMAALVETHSEAEVEQALAVGAGIIGINNRDLSTFRTDLGVTLRLMEAVPPGVVLVSESGIRTEEDVDRLGAAGVDAILVGEALLRADHPGQMADRLSNRSRNPR